MTEAKIKEEISLHLFGALAASQGFATQIARVDEGEDLQLRKAEIIFVKGKARHSASGRRLGIQMKTTTKSQLTQSQGFLHFRLNVKTYNDLIFRKNEWTIDRQWSAPLVLVLHVLPDEVSQWIVTDKAAEHYKMNGLFYWYYPTQNDDFSKFDSKETIKIPMKNLVELDTFEFLFNSFFQKFPS
ncbi:MAG: DUF4365 domain-containing protein [Bacteroidota bacterium]